MSQVTTSYAKLVSTSIMCKRLNVFVRACLPSQCVTIAQYTQLVSICGICLHNIFLVCVLLWVCLVPQFCVLMRHNYTVFVA